MTNLFILRRDCVADMVPVDVCINLMCVLAWKAATSPAPDTEPPVYNCTSGGVNPLTWGRVETEGLPILLRNPYEGVFWYPGSTFKENHYVRLTMSLKAFYLTPRLGANFLFVRNSTKIRAHQA